MRAARTLIPSLLAILALAMPAAAGAASPSQIVVSEINEARSRAGLGRLEVSPSLGTSARKYAYWMMANDYFGHVASIRASSMFDRLGEVLEWHSGRSTQPRRAVARWLRSPPHRAVLLSPAFRYVGVGRSYGRYGSRRATMWVGHFGAR